MEAASASASWHVEEAKLLWAQQRHQVALRLVRALLAAQVSWPTLQHAQLRSLTGKWLAHARCSVSTPCHLCLHDLTPVHIKPEAKLLTAEAQQHERPA